MRQAGASTMAPRPTCPAALVLAWQVPSETMSCPWPTCAQPSVLRSAVHTSKDSSRRNSQSRRKRAPPFIEAVPGATGSGTSTEIACSTAQLLSIPSNWHFKRQDATVIWLFCSAWEVVSAIECVLSCMANVLCAMASGRVHGVSEGTRHERVCLFVPACLALALRWRWAMLAKFSVKLKAATAQGTSPRTASPRASSGSFEFKFTLSMVLMVLSAGVPGAHATMPPPQRLPTCGWACVLECARSSGTKRQVPRSQSEGTMRRPWHKGVAQRMARSHVGVHATLRLAVVLVVLLQLPVAGGCATFTEITSGASTGVCRKYSFTAGDCNAPSSCVGLVYTSGKTFSACHDLCFSNQDDPGNALSFDCLGFVTHARQGYCELWKLAPVDLAVNADYRCHVKQVHPCPPSHNPSDLKCSEVRNRPTRFDHSLCFACPPPGNTLHGPSASSLASTNGKPGSPYHRNEGTLPASSLASTNGKPGSVPYHRNEGTLRASSLATTNADVAEVCHACSRSCRVPRPQPFTPSQANPSTLATSPSPRD